MASSSTRLDPQLSVILPTDTWATIRPVIERLERQTIANRIEVVLVSPTPEELTARMADLETFAVWRVVPTASLAPLGTARALGVRAATAPLVVLGETHTYAHPGWAEALVQAHAAARPIVVPAFGNANPNGILSWAAYLTDYGMWGEGLDRGELRAWPGQNSAYSRDVLLEFGDRLEEALARGDLLWTGLRARGHRAWFEPEARIDHLNIARPGAWLAERFAAGLLMGGDRAVGWGGPRRLAYAAASPLIAAVLSWRTLAGWRRAARRQPVPLATLPAMLLGNVIRAAGEAIGYARGTPGARAEHLMTRYEVRKVDYAARDGR